MKLSDKEGWEVVLVNMHYYVVFCYRGFFFCKFFFLILLSARYKFLGILRNVFLGGAKIEGTDVKIHQ